MAPTTPAPRSAGATIPLLPGDVRLLDAAPVLALVRLDRRLPSTAVRRAFVDSAPRRFAAAVEETDDGVVLRPGPERLGFAVTDAPPELLDALTGDARADGVGPRSMPLSALAGIGLGDAPARDPLCTLVHVRDPDGDALAIRLSHAAGDGISLVRMLDRITAALADVPIDADRRPVDGTTGTTDLGPAGVAGPEQRWLSVLPLSDACRQELDALADARPGLSPTVRRMAVVARRIAPLVRPADDGLRLRIPVDLRFRGLGIPPDAVGNHWLDALAVADGPLRDLPAPADLAALVDTAIRTRAEELRPADVDHREDESLRLLRDVAGPPLRRGVDLVYSALPLPAWPGLRGLLITGSAVLGTVDVRGTDRVALVSPRPLPPGVTAL